jgi:hypothetical protein
MRYRALYVQTTRRQLSTRNERANYRNPSLILTTRKIPNIIPFTFVFLLSLLMDLHPVYPKSRAPRVCGVESVFHFVREEEKNNYKGTQSTNNVKE